MFPISEYNSGSGCQENFELAAHLRDQIRDMESQLSRYEEG
jgi:protein-arginine kinase activator protein McsA